jgi:hypothetical protein
MERLLFTWSFGETLNRHGVLAPLRFSPVPSILLRNDPVRNEPPVLPCIKSIEPCKSGKPVAELQREPGLTNVITLASNENSPGASPRTVTCPARTCSWTTRDSCDRTADSLIKGKNHGDKKSLDDHNFNVCSVPVVPVFRCGRRQ